MAEKKTLQQKIDEACVAVGMSRTKLAKILGVSQTGFNKSVNTGKFSQARLSEIGNALGEKYYAKFEFEDSLIIVVDGKDSILEDVKTICSHTGTELSDLALALGYQSEDKFISKLIKGRFTQEELNAITESVGCRYECGFSVQDISFQIAEANYKAAIENEPEKTLTEAEIERLEAARLRKNARQREYAKKTGYAASAKYNKSAYKSYTINLKKIDDADIIKMIEGMQNGNENTSAIFRKILSFYLKKHLTN